MPDSPSRPERAAHLEVRELAHVFPGASRLGWLLSLGRASRDPVEALRGVTLSVNRGEIVGMLGPNGAGKSTLMRVAAGLVAPSAGEVRVGGADPSALRGSARGGIGLVARNDRSFSQRLTGRQNLVFFARLQGIPSRDRDARIGEALARVQLTDAADRPYRGYSSGMAQRLSIARALLSVPSLLLLDEATGGLDPGKKEVFYAMVRELVDSEGLAVLYATHDLLEAEHFCDRLVVLDEGQIVARGTWAEVEPDAHRVFRARAT